MLRKIYPSTALVTETSGKFHTDLTDASAMMFSEDNDYSSHAASGSNVKLITAYAGSTFLWRAWAGAVGGGEALGVDVFSGFDLTDGWTNSNATIVDANTFSTLVAYGCIQKTGVFTIRKIYKSSFAVTTSGGTVAIWDDGNGVKLIDAGVTNKYFTPVAYPRIINTAIATIDITTMTAEPLTDVPVTGLHLFKDRGLTTRGILTLGTTASINAATRVYVTEYKRY